MWKTPQNWYQKQDLTAQLWLTEVCAFGREKEKIEREEILEWPYCYSGYEATATVSQSATKGKSYQWPTLKALDIQEYATEKARSKMFNPSAAVLIVKL